MSAGPGTKGLMLLIGTTLLPFLAVVIYYSWFDRDICYLRGGGAPWIRNPEENLIIDYDTCDFPAVYGYRFYIPDRPLSARICVYAVKGHSLMINGTALSSEGETARLNWKKGMDYDIRDNIVQGVNELQIFVRSPYSLTALKVVGEAALPDGRKVPINTGDGWVVQSALAKPALGLNREIGPAQVVEYPSFGGMMKGGGFWPGGVYVIPGFLAAALVLVVLPGPFRRAGESLYGMLPGPLKGENARKTAYAVTLGAVFLVLAVVLFHNIPLIRLPITGDYDQHVQYLSHFLTSWRIPHASEGPQMYNPPLLYLLGAGTYKLLASMGINTWLTTPSQIINSLSALTMTAAIFLILTRLGFPRAVVVTTVAVAAFIPMSVYKSASISGESLGACLVSVCFYFALKYAEGGRRRDVALLGIFSGLSFLTRFSASIVFTGISIWFAYRYYMEKDARGRLVKDFAIFSVIPAVMAGWFYVRNIVEIGTPFPIQGLPYLFHFREPPLYRDWHFFTEFKALLFYTPWNWDAVTWSFPAGIYSTVWFDGMRHFQRESYDIALVFVLLGLALLPTLLAAWGAYRTSADVFDGEDRLRRNYGFICLMTVGSAVALYFPYIMKIPHYGVINGSYNLYLLTPLSYFLAVGLRGLMKRAGAPVIHLWITALCIVIIKQFWLPA